MIILVTGSIGFIGSELCLSLLNRGDTIIGIDNHNSYYDLKLKEARLARKINHKNYRHYKADLADNNTLKEIFKTHRPKMVVNLAAQAGVRYSLENPMAYINSNIVGFVNILENCRHYNVDHLVYASTSSVYGANTNLPFSSHDSANHPLTVYAASKKSNELLSHVYSHLYKIPSTGLRFFTVYGPWGRPDMALFKFTKAILKGEPIDVYNFGNHTRDFTYIDDIVSGVIKVLDCPTVSNSNWNSNQPDPATSSAPWRIFNIGNNKPIKLLDYINALEEALGKKASKNYIPMQLGDVSDTCADIDDLFNNFNFKPLIKVNAGIVNFVNWYKSYYKLNE